MRLKFTPEITTLTFPRRFIGLMGKKSVLSRQEDYRRKPRPLRGGGASQNAM